MKKYFFIFILMATKCYSQDFFVNQKSVPQKHLASVLSSNSISGYPVLIPDEPWRFMFSGVYQTTGAGSGLPFGEVYGVKVSDGNVVQYSIDMQANLAQRSDISDWTDEPCKGDNHLWMSSIGGKFKDINCATININSDFKNHNASTYLSVYGKARGINYSIPTTTIEILFIRYAASGRRLQYKVNVNPVHHGFYMESGSNRDLNGWSKSFYLEDENKKKFIQNLSSWVVAVQKRMDRAFAGDLNSFSEIPKYSDYLSRDIINKSTQTDVEEKLSMLKNLYGKGLISERQYDDQVKNILIKNKN